MGDFSETRIGVSGKFFRAGLDKWYAKGFCYGPFAINREGENLPERCQVAADFAHMARLGATCVRTYFPPPLWLLDIAVEHELRILIDVPWEKHRCFFEDWTALEQSRSAIRATARNLGRHPAVFAICVANELPNDVVRFYGPRRVQTFLDELLEIVHQESPECLATYANFPTTEFLQPSKQDFCCFNVYLHDAKALGSYLDRLQHLAGAGPLVITEYGIDSLRHGEDEQADRLRAFLRTSFSHGVAGSFVFSYTDDWFTGGHQIQDWAFGVTRFDRREKPAAHQIANEWDKVPQAILSPSLPRASVVVCSYNGGTTLTECLDSLMKLDYPDYEVILVDDGSADDTSAIAAQFPQVNYIRQVNEGLSVARNVGFMAANGEIVAYTDSDCVVDEHWLMYLVDGMVEQGVNAIGGPNLTPSTDNWIAKCVAASPGNPSHVMFDDQFAEHVPGCNMAFRRDILLEIGGFDPQFRQAGDDVDICWRLLAAKHRIGYAAAAMVWHHRRCTVKAYFAQQRGYGRAEAMLAFKHPQRFAAGLPRFDGVIYGDGKIALPLVPGRIYHGRFGSALFQTIYQPRDFRLHARATSLEWHSVSALLLLLSLMVPALALVSLAMWTLTIGSVAATIREMSISNKYPNWCRCLIFWLHLSQPIVRGFHRNGYCLRNKRLPQALKSSQGQRSKAQRVSGSQWELFWDTTNGHGRERLLNSIVDEAAKSGWPGDFYGEWVPWDIELIADLWHHVTVRTATEELGNGRRFTRARWATKPTRLSGAVVGVVCMWGAVALVTGASWAMVLGVACCMLLLNRLAQSRKRCLRAAGCLIEQAADAAGLGRQTMQHVVSKTAPRRDAPLIDLRRFRRLRRKKRSVVPLDGNLDRTSGKM
jgi:O-antigen biosynthesis protein